MAPTFTAPLAPEARVADLRAAVLAPAGGALAALLGGEVSLVVEARTGRALGRLAASEPPPLPPPSPGPVTRTRSGARRPGTSLLRAARDTVPWLGFGLRAAALSRDGAWLVAAPWDGGLVVASATDLAPQLKTGAGHEFDLVAFFPDGSHFAALSGERRELALGDHEKGLTARLDLPGEEGRRLLESALDISAEGDRIAIGGLFEAAVVRAVEGRWVPGPFEGVTGPLAFLPQGRLLGPDRGGRLRVVAVDPPPRILAAWSLGTTRPRRLRAFPDGSKAVLVPEGPSSPWVIDLATGSRLATLECQGIPAREAAVSPDGQKVAVGMSEGLVRVFDAASGQQELLLDGHEGDVCALAFFPDGERLLSASRRGEVRSWQVR